jgi:hypothetical protein
MLYDHGSWQAEDWLTEEPICVAVVAADRRTQARKLMPGSLTRVERTVVAMSLFDHPSSVEPLRGPLDWVMRILGFRPPNGLADNRLETLRRYSIRLRMSGGALSGEEDGLMRDAGFTDGALNQISRLTAFG